MTERIHILVDAGEKERFRALAARQGKSLSEWLREAAEAKAEAATAGPALDSAEALEAFFTVCDTREPGREPDWPSHRQVIERSMGSEAAES